MKTESRFPPPGGAT